MSPRKKSSRLKWNESESVALARCWSRRSRLFNSHSVVAPHALDEGAQQHKIHEPTNGTMAQGRPAGRPAEAGFQIKRDQPPNQQNQAHPAANRAGQSSFLRGPKTP